jgi:hypothetical protein
MRHALSDAAAADEFMPGIDAMRRVLRYATFRFLSLRCFRHADTSSCHFVADGTARQSRPLHNIALAGRQPDHCICFQRRQARHAAATPGCHAEDGVSLPA